MDYIKAVIPDILYIDKQYILHDKFCFLPKVETQKKTRMKEYSSDSTKIKHGHRSKTAQLENTLTIKIQKQL